MPRTISSFIPTFAPIRVTHGPHYGDEREFSGAAVDEPCCGASADSSPSWPIASTGQPCNASSARATSSGVKGWR